MSDLYQHCSFCGKHKDTVKKLIVGDRVGICNECVTLCEDLLSGEDTEPTTEIVTNPLDPREIKKF